MLQNNTSGKVLYLSRYIEEDNLYLKSIDELPEDYYSPGLLYINHFNEYNCYTIPAYINREYREFSLEKEGNRLLIFYEGNLIEFEAISIDESILKNSGDFDSLVVLVPKNYHKLANLYKTYKLIFVGF